QRTHFDAATAAGRIVMALVELRKRIASEGLDRPSAGRTHARLVGLLGTYFGIYAAAEYVAVAVVWPIAWIAMGFVLFGVPAMMHEAIHGNLYRSKLANRAAGVLGGSLILLCWSTFRSFH